MASISQIPSKQPTQRREDDRAAIRLAISKRQEAFDAFASHKQAIARAHKLVEKSEARAEKAEAGIAEAKIESARHAARAISQGRDDVDANGLLRASRAAAIASQDEVQSFRAALEQLKAEAAGYASAIVEAEVGIAIAVRELIAPHARAALAKLRELDREGVALVGLLRFVVEGDGQTIPSSFVIDGQRVPQSRDALDTLAEIRLQEALDAPFAELKKAIDAFYSGRTDTNNPRPIANEWQEAAKRLREDPDAPLPGSGHD